MSPRDYPKQPIPGVGGVIWRGEEVLLVRQEKYPELGNDFWSIPGGGQETGESVEQALRREVFEETGVEISIGPLILVADVIRRDQNQQVKTHFTVLDFRCEWLSGEASPASDVVETRWVHRSELPNYRMWTLTAETIASSYDWSGPTRVRNEPAFIPTS